MWGRVHFDNDDDNEDYDSSSSVKLDLLWREMFGRLSDVQQEGVMHLTWAAVAQVMEQVVH